MHMEIARAIILATPTAHDRPWSSLGRGPKPLVPVATKPVLLHTLEALREAGVLEVVVLTEPGTIPSYEAVVGDSASWGMAIRYEDRSGEVDVRGALRATNPLLDGEPVLVQRADTMLRGRLRDHIVAFARERLDVLALRLPAPGPGPLPPPGGGYLLSARAVAMMLEDAGHQSQADIEARGGRVACRDVDGCLACHGSEAALLEANRHALEGLRGDVAGSLEGCEIQGPVVAHRTAVLRDTLIRGPVIIGPRVQVIGSYVGPYTSIGARARLEGTEIEHSIVMEGARLLFVGSRLETSIIGRGASIRRRFDMPSALRLSVGDGAEVALS
ncbi:MAG: NTP transferase domain-containing protein [Egibacteraceae bacterium]